MTLTLIALMGFGWVVVATLGGIVIGRAIHQAEAGFQRALDQDRTNRGR